MAKEFDENKAAAMSAAMGKNATPEDVENVKKNMGASRMCKNPKGG